MIKNYALLMAFVLTACATPAPAEKEKKPLSYFVPKAQAEAPQYRIQDEHVYAGIQLLGPAPSNAVPAPDSDDEYFQLLRVNDVSPFTFALLDVIDDKVVGIKLYFISKDSIHAREMFSASRKMMYQKYKISDNIAAAKDDAAMWNFLKEDKWIEYRAADMERRYNMAWLFANRKKLNTGIDEVLYRASVSYMSPTEKTPFYSVGIAYDSHLKQEMSTERRRDLEKSLDL